MPLPTAPPGRVLPSASVLVLAAGLGACASGASRSAGPLRDPMAGTLVTTRIETPQGAAAEVRSVSNPEVGRETLIRANADRVVGALAEAYQGLGLTVNTVLSPSRTLGMREARAPRRLGKAPLSRYLECGADVTGLAHADTYAVTLTVLSRVAPAGDSASLVVTQVAARARSMSTSGNPVNCASTGRLEQAIHDAVTLGVVRP